METNGTGTANVAGLHCRNCKSSPPGLVLDGDSLCPTCAIVKANLGPMPRGEEQEDGEQEQAEQQCSDALNDLPAERKPYAAPAARDLGAELVILSRTVSIRAMKAVDRHLAEMEEDCTAPLDEDYLDSLLDVVERADLLVDKVLAR